MSANPTDTLDERAIIALAEAMHALAGLDIYHNPTVENLTAMGFIANATRLERELRKLGAKVVVC